MNRLVISYLVLRQAVGWVGMALPFVLALGGWLIGLDIQSSISSYYHTVLRDIFVGSLCSIGVFLLCYKGHDRQDAVAGDVAGTAAIGAAICPIAPDSPSSPDEFMGVLHVVFAVTFFLALAYFSFCLFTRTEQGKPVTGRKRCRNWIYRICGGLIVLALILIAAVNQLPDFAAGVKLHNPVFWLESLAIFAFGFSWFTKGQAILKDGGDE